MSRKPEINEVILGVNPLSMSLQIKVRNLKVSEKLLCEFSEGLVMPTGTLEKTYLLEDQPYTKVYHDTFWRDIILDLTPKALQVWTYICFDLNTSKDYYWVNTTFVVSKFKLKNRKELDDIINLQLIRYGLLAKTTIDYVYWINPAVIYCGNRVNKYPISVTVR